MAIQDSFNLSNALNSQSYAYKCWYNYNYGNNTMGISARDMGEITQTWNGELKNWHATAMDDENAYEIEDDDFSAARQDGKDQAIDKTGYDGKQGGQVARTVVDGAMSLGSGILSTGALNGALSGVSTTVTSGAANATASVLGKNAIDADACSSNAGGWIIGAPLSLATAINYTANKPNKEQKEACDELQDEMVNASNALYSAQEDMSAAGEEVTALSDEAQSYNEEANETIEENKSEYDMYRASYDALMAKVNSGEQLTDSEKDLLKELVPVMQELGVGIQDTQEETTETVGDIYSDMGTYQEDYDNAASTVGEVQGLTDYAESFDTSTQNMCYVEGASQSINALSGTKHALSAGKFAASGGLFTAWAWGFVGMGTAAAAMSGIGAKEQFDWAGQVGTEISMREDTQDLNSATNDIYDESIAGYEGAMEGLENFELEMPEDMENPEETIQQITEESGEAISKMETQGNEKAANGTGLAAGIPTNTDGSGNSGQQDKEKEEKF